MQTLLQYYPYWFSPNQLQTLKEVLSYEALTPETLINGIRLELSVAKARTAALHTNMSALTLALGLDENSVPLYFNEDERTFLLNLQLHPTIEKVLQ